MSVTGTTIASRLHTLPASVTTAKTLNAINCAITDAWPTLGVTTFANDAVTLASGTPEYTLSSLSLDPRFGVSQIFLTDDTTLPDEMIRNCRQRYDATTGYWTLILPSDVYETYAGKKLSVSYYAPQAAVASLSTAINLPDAYLYEYVIFWYLKDALYSNERDVSMAQVSWQESRMIETRKRYKRAVPVIRAIGKDVMG